MDLQSARAFKAEFAQQVIRPLIAEAREQRRYGLPTTSRRRATGVEPGIALGIARGTQAHDFRLAVRVQSRALENERVLRDRVEAAGRRDVDIRYIGRVMKDPSRRKPTLPWYQTRQRPLLIGVSIGHVNVTAGTLGAFAVHRDTGRPVALSNNHVLANEGAARIGDVVIQPGSHDGGRRRRDRIGTLLDFVPLEARAVNLVDAAVSSLDDDIAFDATTLTGVGHLLGLREEALEPGQTVLKIGRTTGATRGIVTAIEVDDVVVNYDRGDFLFDRQIEIEGVGDSPFSQGGDSGSVIVDESGMAAALLFAGSDQGGSKGRGLTYANELTLALEALDAELALPALVS